MKLRKSAIEWCWVNFRYEGIPTFSFLCGMVRYSDKFCAKLFDTPLDQVDKLEKPYGTWMRAEPRRRNHTLGSKWLRTGGTVPVNPTADDNMNKVVIEIGANSIKQGGKSRIEVDGNRLEMDLISEEI